MNNNFNNVSTVYFHGQPGSPHETYFLSDSVRNSIHFSTSVNLTDTASVITEKGGASIHLVGFSIGSMAAIKMASEYKDRVSSLTLISPAAPLELGDFLPKMAGKQVFKTAAKSISLFKLITRLQQVGVLAFPETTINILFKDGPEAEIELASQSSFRQALLTSLKYSYGNNRPMYTSAVCEYARPWAHLLKDIVCPVTIFHGEADNWSPVEMAYSLEQQITTNVDLITYPQLGHFTTLHRALSIAVES